MELNECKADSSLCPAVDVFLCIFMASLFLGGCSRIKRRERCSLRHWDTSSDVPAEKNSFVFSLRSYIIGCLIEYCFEYNLLPAVVFIKTRQRVKVETMKVVIIQYVSRHVLEVEFVQESVKIMFRKRKKIYKFFVLISFVCSQPVGRKWKVNTLHLIQLCLCICSLNRILVWSTKI